MIGTGLGSLPGTDMRGSLAAMAEVFDGLVPLPELPARGIGADMIGRTAGLLVDLPTDCGPGGWRLADSTDRAARTARSLLRSDLDDLEETLAGESAAVKISVVGPLTMAACLHLRHGEAVLADTSATRDVTASLAEGISRLLGELRRRMPGVTWTVQIDEPAAPAVLSGAVPTQSGLHHHDPMLKGMARELWRTVLAACEGAGTAVHCCASPIPWQVLWQAGFQTVMCPVVGRGGLDEDPLGLDGMSAWLESGRRVGLGVVDSQRTDEVVGPDRIVDRVLGLTRRLRIDPALVRAGLLTPACGLAGWSQQATSRQCQALARAVGLVEEQLDHAG